MHGMRATWLCVGVGVLAAGVGCARRPNASLEHARAAVQQANQNPDITNNAPVALHEADQQLQQADRAYEKGKDDAWVDHYAYLAERKVDVARANAQEKLAEKEVARLNEQRGEVVARARTGEAAAVREEAAGARRELQRLKEELSTLHPRQTDRGVVLTLSNVVFEFNRASLKPGAMNDLAKLAAFLKEHPDQQVTIEGHTDSIGSDVYNRQLSEERANAVREYLVRSGVAPEQIVARGYGKDYPVATNNTEAGRQANRRVDIVIGSPSAATAGVGRKLPPEPKELELPPE